jgi:hypothetical protein
MWCKLILKIIVIEVNFLKIKLNWVHFLLNLSDMIHSDIVQGWAHLYLNGFNASMTNYLFIFRMHFGTLNIIFSLQYKIISIFNMNENHCFILIHIIHLKHFLNLVCMWFYMKFLFLFANKVQYAIEMKLIPWLFEIITNLPAISTLWTIFKNEDQPFPIRKQWFSKLKYL